MSTNIAPSVTPTLPWVRDRRELPAPLPTRAQIESATTEFPSIFDASARRTVLVGGLFVVKYGPAVFENEGHALLRVESYPDIPSPRLYAMYREEENLYIIMEFVQGQRLSDVWPCLSEDQKVHIAGQLRRAQESLRSIPSPGYYGGVFGGPLPHRYFFSADHNPRITGPFYAEEDLCHALVLRSRENWNTWGRRSWMTDFFARHLSRALSGHRSVFTHSDFQRKNILIAEEESSSVTPGFIEKKTFRVTAILDWESAGWYPTYWGFALCFAYFDWSDDWPEKVEMILDPYVNESALMRLLGQDLDA
ncbi:phosphotransferase enzyme family protein [Hirsutella rhossiliensis]|uniref:Phosphotransferase enzyme family domain-containing protein n=1 Tax=Hirsutella rhossiliensis TaxID=111463 RepID=A0A9P8MX99_9HYPO|nr:phosphotransferase enzyme family domain-containing protein [Hirsutella rhossiliensis]KAH0963778.1 phosphotransferase enzyme family domain-containing protein [Hirsutella rhossiliensis]